MGFYKSEFQKGLTFLNAIPGIVITKESRIFVVMSVDIKGVYVVDITERNVQILEELKNNERIFLPYYEINLNYAICKQKIYNANELKRPIRPIKDSSNDPSNALENLMDFYSVTSLGVLSDEQISTYYLKEILDE